MSDYPYFPRSMLYPLDSSEFIGFALPTGQMQKGRAHVCSALSVARVGPRVALQQLFTDERSAYQAREIIEGIMEETFQDCKDLLELRKLMDKQQRYLELMIALSLITYVAGLWLGEAVRDVVFG
jgi:hypothetical protein